jgi:hypothetical protein
MRHRLRREWLRMERARVFGYPVTDEETSE